MAETTNRKNIDLSALDYYDEKMKEYVQKKIGTGGLTIDSELSDISENPVENKVIKKALDDKAENNHNHTKSDITDFPTSLPANGGNADTVNNHSVNADVPFNAVFTDTTSFIDILEEDPVNPAEGYMWIIKKT